MNGLPPAYQPVIVNITGTPLASLTFEDVVTHLMNEEGHLRNIQVVSPTATPSVTSDSHDQAYAAMHVLKGKSSKSTLSKDMSEVRCHECGGVGHYCSDCPTHDSDAANIAVADDDHDEEQALTAIADEIKETW